MKTKPVFFTIMPLVFVALAALLPLQVAVIYDLSPFAFGAIYSKLTPINLLLFGLFFWMAAATYKLDKNLFLLLPFINLIVFINNYIVGSLGNDFGILQTTLASIAFLGLSLSFYSKNVYKTVTETNFRWWLTTPRQQISAPLTIFTQDNVIKTKSFDLSETGIFAVTDPQLALFQTAKDQEIELDIHLEDQILKCKGHIVRKSMSKGKYPEGVGIHFSKVDRCLNSILAQNETAMAA